MCPVLFRHACTNFTESCKKKNEDRLWIDELAVMQACSRSELSYQGTSGIILTGEDNDSCQNLMINVHNAALSSVRPSGSIDAESTASHGSLDINQGMFECPYFLRPPIHSLTSAILHGNF